MGFLKTDRNVSPHDLLMEKQMLLQIGCQLCNMVLQSTYTETDGDLKRLESIALHYHSEQSRTAT